MTLLKTLLATALVAASLVSGAHAQDRTIKFAFQNQKDHPQAQGAQKFADLVAAKSGGKIQVKLFPGGTLGGDLQTVSALQGGTVEMTVLNAGILSAQTKEFGIYDFPFLFASPQEADAVTDGPFGKKLLDKLKAAKPDLPVIVMSAHTDVASPAGAFRGGAHEFLSKPFDLDEAVALVRRALPDHQADERPRALPQAPAQAEDVPTLVGEAPARSWWRARCTSIRPWQTAPSWPSTLRPSRRTCWSPNCLAMSAAPSPVRRRSGVGALSKPRAARSFWTKSATCRLTCRPACCACCLTGSSTAWAATAR